MPEQSPLKQNKIVALDELIPHPNNYRSHPDEQVQNLVLSLQRFGQGRSIVIKLASHAALWYNKPINIVAPAMLQTSQGRISLYERNTMTTLPLHANNDNPSPIPATSGIYKITCTATGKIYIGSTFNLYHRRWAHFRSLQQNKHRNIYLQRAFNKYGEGAFIFEVLELVLPISLTSREQYWFNRLKPFNDKGFNIARDATSCLGIKRSPECREKLRQLRIGKETSPETREKLRQISTGRVHSPEQIEKQRQAVLGRKKSPEAIEKYRQAALNRYKRSSDEIEAIRTDRASGMTHRQLVRKYGIGSSQLVQILKGETS